VSEDSAFLARYAPFRDLGVERLEAIAAGLRTASYPPDALILQQSGEPAGSLFVIREGIAYLLDEDRVIDHLEQGEVFGISVLSGMGPALSVRARTPIACYLIEPELAREVMGSAAGLAYLTAAAAHWRERVPVEQHLRRTGSGGWPRRSGRHPVWRCWSRRCGFLAIVGSMLDAADHDAGTISRTSTAHDPPHRAPCLQATA
jgi:hypothetical protein